MEHPSDLDAARAEPGYIGLDAHGPIFRPLAADFAAVGQGPAWWPRADTTIQRAPEDGGSLFAGFGERAVWHTTETAGWPGYGSGSFPHLTVKVEAGRFLARQHIPFTRAARALRNEAGGVQTNRLTRCQVEIVTFADVVDERGLDPAMVEGLADLAEWLEQEWGVPRTCSVTFKPYPASFGKGNGVRLGAAAWERYAGWCGHQHVPENDHGDPGALDWRRILQPVPEVPDMTTEELLDALESDRGQRALEKAVTRVLRVAVWPDDAKTPAGVYFGDLATTVHEIHGAVVEPPPA